MQLQLRGQREDLSPPHQFRQSEQNLQLLAVLHSVTSILNEKALIRKFLARQIQMGFSRKNYPFRAFMERRIYSFVSGAGVVVFSPPATYCSRIFAALPERPRR